MVRVRLENYYEARGFGVYYFCNAVFNVVKNSSDYIRGIEDILGDMRVLTLMRPFHQYTNLHGFIWEIAIDILTEEIGQEGSDCRFLREFLATYNVDCPSSAFRDEDSFWFWTSESIRFHDALDELVDEIFHILFNDIGFLQIFNELCASYIENSGFGEEHKSRAGTLKRVRIPKWARRAIFHRDKGECRVCKRSLAAMINQLESERYDHIVPLAQFGANDVTNLQLLCEPCNLNKSDKNEPVSKLIQRAISNR